MAYPSFSVGEVLTANDMNAVGLWKIADTTFTTTANPQITGCFSSNFDNYVVKFAVFGSAPANLFFQVLSGTSTVEGGAVYDRYGFQWTGATGAQDLTAANQTSALIGDVGTASATRTSGTIEIMSPNLANIHTICLQSVWDGNNGYSRMQNHRIETNTQYTGIRLTASGGATLTGTIRVYGYRN